MRVQGSADKKFAPDRSLIKQHLEFIVYGMEKEFGDGFIEIAYGNQDNDLNQAQKFALDQIDAAVDFAVDKNSKGRNVYTMGAILSPDAPVDKRSTDDDFYACNAVWCDIDDAPDLAFLRNKYKDCPPSKIIVTGRHPNLRIHLWWKLDEAIEDHHELRGILRGIQESLGGDPKTTNECRLMRLGGSVAWPVKKKAGRITEQTEVTEPANVKKIVNAEALKRVFPSQAKKDDDITHDPSKDTRHTKSTVAGLQPETVVDGRDAYMSDMAYASVINLAGQLNRWPTAQEVFDDVWPVYSSRVKPRDPRRTLDDEGRGAECLKHKIKSKLRGFSTGRMRITLEDCRKQYEKRKQQEEKYQGQQSSDQNKKSENASHETNTENQKRLLKLDEWVASKRYTGTAKPIKWLVEGVFPAGVPCLLAAMGGLGKSFIALDMAIKIAMPPSTVGDHKVLGRSVMSHGTAVLITAEDSFDSIHRRINRLAPPELLARTMENLIVIPMSEVDISQLLVKEGRNGLEMTDFFIEIKNQLMAVKNLKFIGIDPLQAFVGADITAKPEAAQFMWSAFAKIASQTGATFFATHHMRKDGMGEIRTAADAREGIRGTTGLVDGARAVYVMWQAVKDIGEAIARAINVNYEPHRFVQGSIVKANDEADHSVMSFYRKDEGVLFCLGQIETTGATKDSSGLNPNQEAVYRAIKNAMVAYGRQVTPYRDQKPVTAISYDELRKQLEAEGYKEFVRKEGDTENDIAIKAKNGTTNARMALHKRGLIGFEKNWIWLREEPASIEMPDEFGEVKEIKIVNEAFKNEFD